MFYFRGWSQCILVCLLTCPLKRAHQYICHHWITLQIKIIINKSKWILWITRELFPIILVQDPHSDPFWKKHCMTNKTIIKCFQYPVKTTVFTVSRTSFHTGCSNLTSMFWYVFIFQQMTYFFAVQTPPNMIGLTVKHIIIKKQLKLLFNVPGVLFCTTFQDGLNADWLVYWCVPLREHTSIYSTIDLHWN